MDDPETGGKTEVAETGKIEMMVETEAAELETGKLVPVVGTVADKFVTGGAAEEGDDDSNRNVDSVGRSETVGIETESIAAVDLARSAAFAVVAAAAAPKDRADDRR